MSCQDDVSCWGSQVQAKADCRSCHWLRISQKNQPAMDACLRQLSSNALLHPTIDCWKMIVKPIHQAVAALETGE